MSANKDDSSSSSNKWVQWMILAVVLMIFLMNLSTQGAGAPVQVVETKQVRTGTQSEYKATEETIAVKDDIPRATPPPTSPPTPPPTVSPTLPPTQLPTQPPTPAVVPLPEPAAPVAVEPIVPPPVATPVSSPLKQMSPSQVDELSRKFQTAKANLRQKLEEEYGSQYFQSMFVDTDAGRQTFNSPSKTDTNMGLSWERMRQRIEYKFMQSFQGQNPTFVWITAGHSSTAGHGNYFEESYTAVMERHVQSLFAAVGIAFEARNYAMGGTVSSPEAATCFEEIYGADEIDVAVWDYGYV